MTPKIITRGFVNLRVLIILLLIIVSVLSVYLLIQFRNNPNLNENTSRESPIITNIPSELKSNEVMPTYPPNNKDPVINTFDCDTKFSLPPRITQGNEPYWQAPRGSFYPNLLSLINRNVIDTEYSQYAATYTPDDASSGYVEAAVVVSCVNFRMSLLFNNEILNALNMGIVDYNQGKYSKGMGPDTYTLTQSTVNKWGREVLLIELNSDDYYTFVGKNGVYEVRAFGQSVDPKILKERQKILDTLEFE